MAQLPLRPCVGLLLFNKQGLVFIGRRFGMNAEHGTGEGAWQMPQGGIDPHEEPLEAALRELYEETGVMSARLLRESAHWYDYELPIDIAKENFKGKYRGQTQKWFAFRFEGEESEINITKDPQEFNAWRWEKLENLPALIVPFKRKVYEQVCAEFKDLA
jgi:putative (di)nucleoside polyphosphate hydrolase